MKKIIVCILGDLNSNESEFINKFNKKGKHELNKLIKSGSVLKVSSLGKNEYTLDRQHIKGIGIYSDISAENLDLLNLKETKNFDFEEILNTGDNMAVLIKNRLDFLLKSDYNFIVLSFSIKDFKSPTHKKVEILNKVLKDINQKVKKSKDTLIILGTKKENNVFPLISTTKIKTKEIEYSNLNETLYNLFNKTQEKKLNKLKMIVIINLMLLLLTGLFYLTRLIYYYRLENSHQVVDKSFNDILIDKAKLTNSIVEDNGYYYKGNVTDNYLYFSGNLYRILSIDKSGNIKLVTDDNVKFINVDNEKYLSSNLHNWLDNNKFLENTNENLCLNECKVNILTLSDYERSGNSKGFLNNNSVFWIKNNESINYVNKAGKVANYTGNNYGIRLTFTLKSDVKLLSGTGDKDNPYIVEQNNNNELVNKSIGEYIKLSNYVFRIIDKNDYGVKVVLNDYLKNDTGEYIKTIFDEKSNVFGSKTSIYKELLLFQNKLDDEKLIEGNWDIGYYTNGDYDITKNTIFKSKIGLLSLNDYYLNDYREYFLLNGTSKLENTIYTISESERIYADLIDKKMKIVPVVYLKKDINILSGTGTKNNPYEI